MRRKRHPSRFSPNPTTGAFFVPLPKWNFRNTKHAVLFKHPLFSIELHLLSCRIHFPHQWKTCPVCKSLLFFHKCHPQGTNSGSNRFLFFLDMMLSILPSRFPLFIRSELSFFLYCLILLKIWNMINHLGTSYIHSPVSYQKHCYSTLLLSQSCHRHFFYLLVALFLTNRLS